MKDTATLKAEAIEAAAVDWHDVMLAANKTVAKERAQAKAAAPKTIAELEDAAIAKAKANGGTVQKITKVGGLDAAIKRATDDWKLHPTEDAIIRKTLRPEDVEGKTADDLDALIRIIRRATRKTFQTIVKKG